MVFVDYGIGEENEHYLYLKDIVDNDSFMLKHLGFEPLDSNDGSVIGQPDIETWVKYEKERDVMKNVWLYEVHGQSHGIVLAKSRKEAEKR